MPRGIKSKSNRGRRQSHSSESLRRAGRIGGSHSHSGRRTSR